MSETNTIVTTGAVESAPASGCPDAKREGGQMQASAAPPLPGRRCPLNNSLCPCDRRLRRMCGKVRKILLDIGERSGPGNDEAEALSLSEVDPPAAG